MAVREYIGARYVPIFGREGETGADWDNSAPYEPLTVVVYQGDSYTSRQYVPAGIDINNEDYWIQTGNFSSQIEQYRQEVRAFDGRITATEDAIDTIEGNGWVTTPRIADGAVTNSKVANNAITSAKIADGSITSDKLAADAVTTAKILDGNVTAAKLAANAVTTAKVADGAITGAKIADGSITSGKLAADAVTTAKILDGNVTAAKLAGNSVTTAKIADNAITSAKIADGTINNTDLATPVWVIIGDSYTDTYTYQGTDITIWPNLISFWKNIIVKNYAKAGAGYVHSSGTPFPQQAAQAAADTSFNHANVERVIVYGGINDLDENKATVQTNAGQTFITLRGAFPNANICAYFNWHPHVFGLAEMSMIDAVAAMAASNRIGFSTASIPILFNYRVADAFLTDNIHPNQLGQRELACFFNDPANHVTRLAGPRTILGAQSFGDCYLSAAQYSAGTAVAVARQPSTTFTYNDDFTFDLQISDASYTVSGITANDAHPIILNWDLDSGIYRYFTGSRFYSPSSYTTCNKGYHLTSNIWFQNGQLHAILYPQTDNWGSAGDVTIGISIDLHAKIY